MNRPEDKNAPSTEFCNAQSSKTAAAGHPSRKEAKPPKIITETYLHNSGLYYMQRYAASVTQFRRVMQRKIDKSCRHHTDQDRSACAAMLNALVEKFIRAGLLNDESFARSSVISLRRRGLSQRMIVMKLQNKGLSEDQIKAALAEFNDENETGTQTLEIESALKLAKKKRVGPYAAGDYDRKKALAAFARAGFSMEIIRKVLDMNLDTVED